MCDKENRFYESYKSMWELKGLSVPSKEVILSLYHPTKVKGSPFMDSKTLRALDDCERQAQELRNSL